MIGLAATASKRATWLHRRFAGPATITDLRNSDGLDPMSKDVLALICPDWRSIALVVEGPSGHVAYANFHCLEMFARREPAQLIGGRLLFTPPELNRLFYAKLGEASATGAETAVAIGRSTLEDSWIAVTIRNTQGFFRDALQRNLDDGDAGSQMMLVEIARHGASPDTLLLAAFADACGLTGAESRMLECLSRGLCLDRIADIQDITLSTARQRMKRILAKTHCHRQAELVHLVMSLCGGG
ncbi:helix-turn-helix transcriptional regulator [Taklimakanibacter lacteus]|uniref:helix-turn-helix transcriptional regulator n=1 Tax=Taklimakanibacter lacteus TaxID=2268456 RepID=UPI000E661D0E